jgi:acyl carrier protein
MEDDLDLFETIRNILVELLDVDAEEIGHGHYLVRDLAMESIDFLELAVSLNERFRIDVHDDTVFLRNLRFHMAKAQERGVRILDELKEAYGFLSAERLQEILSDLEGGPVIQVRDLVSYVQWQMNATRAA